MVLTQFISLALFIIAYHVKVIAHYKLLRFIQNPDEDRDTSFFTDFYTKQRNGNFNGLMSILLIQDTFNDAYIEKLKDGVNTWIVITRWLLIFFLIATVIMLIQNPSFLSYKN